MENTTIRINSLINIINKYQPNTLAQLKTKYGYTEANKKLLTPGINLGEKTLADAHLYLEVSYRGLQTAKQRIQPNIKRLKERLGNAKRIRLVGQIIGAITSVGLISALLANWKRELTIGTAFINFFAVLCTLLAGNLESPMHGGAGNLIEMYEMLVNTDVESEQLIQEFEILRQTSSSQESIMEKVANANALAAKLLKTEKLLWS